MLFCEHHFSQIFCSPSPATDLLDRLAEGVSSLQHRIEMDFDLDLVAFRPSPFVQTQRMDQSRLSALTGAATMEILLLQRVAIVSFLVSN